MSIANIITTIKQGAHYMHVIQKLLLIIISPIIFALILFSCKHPPIEPDTFTTINQSIDMSRDWHIRSSTAVEGGGEIVSGEDIPLDTWYKTNVPATVMTALIENDVYKDPLTGTNLKSIPASQFNDTWWYRKAFTIDKVEQDVYYTLVLRGINYSADIFINKKKVAGRDIIRGAFRNFTLDVTDYIREGTNVIALEVMGPEAGDFTIGFIDWNPYSPDKNMGIWRPVELYRTGKVSMRNPFVTSTVNTKTLKKAALTLETTLVNHSQEIVEGILTVKIDDRNITTKITLEPGDEKIVRLLPEDYKALKFGKEVKLWWPNGMGEQHLYTASFYFIADGVIQDKQETTFGIRQIEDYTIEKGHRGYKVNGKEVLIRGGGWVDDIFLHDTPEKLEAQIQYLKHINLNAIRMEGFWGQSRRIFELCDEYGILIMAGWSCQWEWEEYIDKKCDEYGAVKTREDMTLIAQSLHDQVLWLRNHPSIFVWALASDLLPRPALEGRYRSMLLETDRSRPALASTAWHKSTASGVTGVKMNGPYAYVPPVYWYQDKYRGGAFGFNTETGPGAQPPVIESLKKMIPEEDLWPINSTWDFHCNRGVFDDLNIYMNALKKRYGEPESLIDFDKKAQMTNYEAMRGMFEAFRTRRSKTTGIFQWLANSAWPSMMWQLYDYYLMPTGALYGAKAALKPVQLTYDYYNTCVTLVTDYGWSLPGGTVKIDIYDIHGNEIMTETINVKAVDEDSQTLIHQFDELNELPAETMTYFIILRLYDKSDTLITDNRYWISKKVDKMKFSSSTWFYTPQREYADFSALNALPPTTLVLKKSVARENGRTTVAVTLENKGTAPAFGVFIDVKNPQTGETIKPLFLDDNYLIILPGETKTVTGHFASLDDSTIEPLVTAAGWNTGE